VRRRIATHSMTCNCSIIVRMWHLPGWSGRSTFIAVSANVFRLPGGLALIVDDGFVTGATARDVGTSDSDASPTLHDKEVELTAGPVSVAGHLTVPEHPAAKHRAQ